MSKLTPFQLHGRAMAELGRAQGLRQAISALKLSGGREYAALVKLAEGAQRAAEKLNAQFDETIRAEISRSES